MKLRNAFSMIELIFVIVVMGIIGKFGVEFLAQAYKSFIFTSVNNELQQNSANALEFIGARLQYRIKDSTIARVSTGSAPIAIGSATGSDIKVLEWVAEDIDGLRGTTAPTWGGIIDLDAGSKAALELPASDLTAVDSMIQDLTGSTTVDNPALFFIGANSDIQTGYGWDPAFPITDQQGAMHPIDTSSGATTQAVSSIAGVDFSNIDVYEYFKLAWTANALVYTPGTNGKGTLTFYYNYQPWLGETLTDANTKSAILMENVSTFRFVSLGSVVKIQICVKSDVVEEYSLCKEKTIF